MDDKSRLAIHKAVASNAANISTAASPTIDAYSRDAAALLIPGLSHRDVLACVSQRMGLAPVQNKKSDTIQEWEITQSTKYSCLRVAYDNNFLASWQLVHKPSGR